MEIKIEKSDDFLILNNSQKVLFELIISLVITGIIFFILCWGIITAWIFTIKLMLLLVLLFSVAITLVYVFKTYQITKCLFNNPSNTLIITLKSIFKKNHTHIPYDDIYNINVKSVETKKNNDSKSVYKHEFSYKYCLYLTKKNKEEVLLYTFSNKNSANDVAKEVKRFLNIN